MNKKQFSLRHLLMAFGCGMLLVGGVSLMAPHRVSSGVYGDVNGDGVVDVDDLNEVINVMLGKPHGGNHDGNTFTVNGVTFNMVSVEGGTFMMGATQEQLGDADSDEKPAHRVTLSSYSIGETEVTQELWQAVMGDNPSHFTGNLQRPVEQVSWNDCQEFITKLNALTGEHFRLPTEAEWEYAARGGNKSQGYKYAGSNALSQVGWYEFNAEDVGEDSPDYGTHAVATKAPNELGLYDMSGNVWERCSDWHSYTYYDESPEMNPQGPSTGSYRVARGGAWDYQASRCRVSYRHRAGSDGGHNVGLRLAR
ncbi:MAG: SUMF1/EgtB/PvdO family nonheme iron enzyme [Muribaculaceae bacterium]|nr:SUMF1/EgtB/PvdO family nonheme iron enzyme [Muribaculaceae bacterium]